MLPADRNNDQPAGKRAANRVNKRITAKYHMPKKNKKKQALRCEKQEEEKHEHYNYSHYRRSCAGLIANDLLVSTGCQDSEVTGV